MSEQSFDPEHPERGWTKSEPLSFTPEHPKWRWWIHNLIAHPLLILCPPLGEWLHEGTTPPPTVDAYPEADAQPPCRDIWAVRAQEILDTISYRDWKFWSDRGWTGKAIVEVSGEFPDFHKPGRTFKATRAATVQVDTDEGVIVAAFEAVKELEVHEMSERFMVAGKRPFDPHTGVQE